MTKAIHHQLILLATCVLFRWKSNKYHYSLIYEISYFKFYIFQFDRNLLSGSFLCVFVQVIFVVEQMLFNLLP